MITSELGVLVHCSFDAKKFVTPSLDSWTLNDALYIFAFYTYHSASELFHVLLQSNTQQMNAHYTASICWLLFSTIVAGNNSHDATLEHPVLPEPFVSFSDLTVFQSPHTKSTSANCSLPLMIILRVLSWATTCLWEPRRWRVCARVPAKSVCVHSLKGNASFDFLLITQHALCSVVNCPGPLFSQWGTGLEWSENTSSLSICLSSNL